MKMGTCQFLKDFRRAYNVKKTAEHRKRVLQRKTVVEQRKDHLEMTKIAQDRSVGKQTSHTQLSLYIAKHGAAGLKRVYNKKQLTQFCQAYAATTKSKDNKTVLAGKMMAAIAALGDSAQIPHPYFLDRLQVQEPTIDNGGVRLRIKR